MSTLVKKEIETSPVLRPEVHQSLPLDENMLMEDDGNMEEEEDEVVREIDVFLSPELANQIHLLQYPLQHSSVSSLVAARVKPRHCMVELDFQTPSNVGSYGHFHMASRSYTSQTIPVSTHMALAKMVDKPGFEGLHLVPLSKITQMKPSYAHVDEAAGNASATTEDEIKQREREAAKLERKPLAFQKKESERAAIARKSSYSYKKASEESELWNDLEVHTEGSPEMNHVLTKVVCPSPGENLLVTKDDEYVEGSTNGLYVQSLNYLPLAQRNEEKAENEEEATSVCTKLVGLMQQGWPIPYPLMRAQFPKAVSDEKIFQALGSCAFYVRGNFVLQSRLMPLEPSVARARTFILFLFQIMEVVHRARVEYVYEGDDEVTSEAILMLLEQIGKKTDVGWQLKVDDDPMLADQFPSAVKVHLEFWGDQVRRYRPLLDRYREAR